MDAKKLLLIKSLVTSRPVSSCFREIAELIEKAKYCIVTNIFIVITKNIFILA